MEESFSDEVFTDGDAQKESAEHLLPTILSSESQDSLVSTQISVRDSITAESTPDAPQSAPMTIMQHEPKDSSIPEIIADNTTQTITAEPLLQDIPLPEPEIPVVANPPVLEYVAKDTPPENSPHASAAAMTSKHQDTSHPDNPTPVETLNKVFTPSITKPSGAEIKNDDPKTKDLHESERENADEITIDEHKIHLAIPKDILKQVRTFNPRASTSLPASGLLRSLRRIPN